MLTDLFLSNAAVSISTSFVIIFLLIFAPFLNKRYAIKWKYFIWIAIAVRLMIPFQMNVSVLRFVIGVPAQMTNSIEAANHNDIGEMPSLEQNPMDAFHGGVAPTVTQAGSKPMKRTLLDVIAYLWAAGCLLFVSVHLFSFLHYKRQVICKGVVVEEEYILRQICKLSGELRIKPDVRVVRYQDAGSPLVIGFLKPVLVLPDCDYSKEELFFVLKHEYCEPIPYL